MTAKELIDALSKYPPEQELFQFIDEIEGIPISGIIELNVRRISNLPKNFGITYLVSNDTSGTTKGLFIE